MELTMYLCCFYMKEIKEKQSLICFYKQKFTKTRSPFISLTIHKAHSETRTDPSQLSFLVHNFSVSLLHQNVSTHPPQTASLRPFSFLQKLSPISPNTGSVGHFSPQLLKTYTCPFLSTRITLLYLCLFEIQFIKNNVCLRSSHCMSSCSRPHCNVTAMQM